MTYQPKTGQPCTCRPGDERDSCPQCEGTGQRIDFAAIRRAASAAHTPGPWYEAKTGNGQGLVISETTGANVAVAYDKRDAGLIAVAPTLLHALEVIAQVADDGTHQTRDPGFKEIARLAREACGKVSA